MRNEETNEQRAENARETIFRSTYEENVRADEGDVESAISDLMTDLLHLCDREGIDTEVMLERITRHHRDEE